MTGKIALLTALLAAATLAGAEDKTPISVKNASLNNGVVIVNALEGKTPFELQCNKEQTTCRLPDPGQYLMAKLPKNWGVYDCQCVDLYVFSSDAGTDTEKLGEYCLIEK